MKKEKKIKNMIPTMLVARSLINLEKNYLNKPMKKEKEKKKEIKEYYGYVAFWLKKGTPLTRVVAKRRDLHQNWISIFTGIDPKEIIIKKVVVKPIN